MELKEEIRSRLSIEDVIGEYVNLKRAGRNFKGISPFTSERTPSFYVSPDKQIWHDFSGGKGGDVFSFVMEVEGLDFKQALEMLARKAGVDMSQYQTGGDKTLSQKKQRLLSALSLSVQYYQQSLIKNKTALKYVVEERKFNKKVLADFGIGYAPDADTALINALTNRKFTHDELKSAGLTTLRRGSVQDMFKGRIMIPLHDGQGQTVGFTARLLYDNPKAPKYINTPQTILYDKGRQLYGLHLAKDAIRKTDKAVVVEGNLDVISSHQYDIKHVVAAAGTALTDFHLKSLSRLTQNIAISFDADQAGIKATERAIDLAQAHDIRLSVVSLPDGVKDPDELVQRDPEEWRAAIDSSTPAVEWLMDRYQKLYDLTGATGKRDYTTKILNVVNKLRDPVEREHYVEKLSLDTGASLGALIQKANDMNAKNSKNIKHLKMVKSELARGTENTSTVQQDALLAIALCDSGARDALRNLRPADFSGDERGELLAFLQDHPKEAITETVPSKLLKHETYVKVVLLQAETRYSAWSPQERYFEAASLARAVINQKRTAKKQQLLFELRQAESVNDTARLTELKEQLNLLIKEQS